MRSGTRVALCAIAALVLQTTLLPRLAIGRATPDLLLIMCVYLGLHQHTIGGSLVAFLLGYLEDTFSGSLVGLNGFGMCLVFMVVYLTSRRLWVDNAISKIVVVFLASAMKTSAVLLLMVFFLSVEGQWPTMVRHLLVQATITAVVSPAVFAALLRAQGFAAAAAD